jgi:hypothetical protein
MMASQNSVEHPSSVDENDDNGALPLANNVSGAPDKTNPLMGSEKKHSNQNPKHAQFGKSQLSFLKPWWMEIIACVLVLLALVAIVLTLAIRQNQPLPDWPFGISVNSAVSVFVVILKGGMLLILGEGSLPILP